MVDQNVIIIYSFIELYNGNSAGSARVMNYARSLSDRCKVILLSFQRRGGISIESIKEIETNIFTVGELKSKGNRLCKRIFYPFYLFQFMRDISVLISKSDKRQSVTLLLYPATAVLIDFFSVLYLIKLKGYDVFYELNELRRYAVSLDRLGKYHPKRLKFIFSEYLIKFFKGVICISYSIEEYIQRINKNTIRIPILTNKKLLMTENKRNIIQHKVLKIGFFGSVNDRKENLFLFIESLSLLKKQNTILYFDLYGNIDPLTKEKLPKIIDFFGLQGYVKYNGNIDQKILPRIMRQYDLLVLPRGNTLQNKYGFSTKLSEYMASGVPVLVTDVSDNTRYITNGVNGFIAEPDSLKSMVIMLKEVFSRKKDLKMIADAAKLTVNENFLYENYTEQLVHFLCNN
jgi:glycosyltransferase involved in cell wall biosynthesis